MNFRFVLPALSIITIVFGSCNLKYSKYNADWIVTNFEIDGVNSLNIIGIYNFKINLNSNQVTPMGLYLESADYMVRDKTKVIISSAKGNDYIQFEKHPLLVDKYQIKCIDSNCCTLSIQNEKIYLEMIYNSEIPYGRKRKCPMPSDVMSDK